MLPVRDKTLTSCVLKTQEYWEQQQQHDVYSVGLSLCNWVCRMTWHLVKCCITANTIDTDIFFDVIITFFQNKCVIKTSCCCICWEFSVTKNSNSLMQENMSFCASDLQCVILWMSNSVFMLNSDSILVPTYLTTSPPHLHSNLCLSCLLNLNLERANNNELDSIEHFSALRLFRG